MNIVWQYLDKKQAAINALKDYINMQYIIEDTDQELVEAYEEAQTPRSSVPTGMPRTDNPKSSEEWIATSIDRIDVLKERYRQALEYMNWFKPAWQELSDEERFILNMFFLSNLTKSDAVLEIGQNLNLERTQIYYRKDRALDRLTILLYGK
jgi:DNA-directed RNA polymerase specialized sigma subunit